MPEASHTSNLNTMILHLRTSLADDVSGSRPSSLHASYALQGLGEASDFSCLRLLNRMHLILTISVVLRKSRPATDGRSHKLSMDK